MLKKFPSHMPKLVVRVGLVGFAELSSIADFPLQSLHAAVGRTLGLIREQTLNTRDVDLYEGGHEFRLLLSPGNGFDYLSTGVAIDLGFKIQIILPFDRQQYRRTFLKYTESKKAFDETLLEASEIVELDGSSARDSAQTEAMAEARRAVLRQSDVLIMWGLNKEEMSAFSKEVCAKGLPLLKIDYCPYKVTFLENSLTSSEPPRETDIGSLKKGLEAAITLASTKENRKKLVRFLGSWHFRRLRLFQHFQKTVSSPLRWRAKSSGEDAPHDIWETLPAPNGTMGIKIAERFKTHFDRADSLANAYGDLYRSCFLLTYGFGALASLLAFCGVYLKIRYAFQAEFFLILCIILIAAAAYKNRLHERWGDYRMLGEGLRQMTILAPLARVTPAFEVPAYLDDDPGRTWFNWYFRALIREAGIISAEIDCRFLETYRIVLEKAILGQIKYHTDNSGKMDSVHKILRWIVLLFLFPVTLIACIAHMREGHSLQGGDFFLSLFAIVFPAIGAALEGIAHQGDLDRIHRRSGALKLRLENLLERLRRTPITSRDIGDLAENFSQIQVLEQADWRAAFVSRPITPA